MYILEGNIGAGKSTFLSLLQKHIPNLEVLTEPVGAWNQKNYGQSLLENFYKDTPRWAYTLETLTMICRSRDHMQEQRNKNPNRVLERSIYSGHYCFAQNSYESGCMTDIEWKIYNEWANFLIHDRCSPPLGFIYLRANASVCYTRVQKRNRESEKSLSLDYLKQVEERHDQFLIEKKGLTSAIEAIPVLTIDCNEDFVENPQNMVLHAAKVQAFLTKTQDPQAYTQPITPPSAHSQSL